MTLTLLSLAHGGEHKLTSINGKGVRLSTQGHAISGNIGDHLVFGVVTGKKHDTATLLIHDDGKILRTNFGNKDGEWGGTITEKAKSSALKFKSFDKGSNTYTIAFNDKEFEVKVGFDKYENNHFINPSYTMDYYGKTLSVKMKDGQACKKYSLQLIFMIFGTFLHNL